MAGYNSIPDHEEWVTVHVAANSFEADIVRGLLDEEGLTTVNEADLGGVILGKSGSIRIRVPQDEGPSARELLRAYHGPQLKIINLSEYLPEPPTRFQKVIDAIAQVLSVPLLILIVLSLTLVVLRWA